MLYIACQVPDIKMFNFQKYLIARIWHFKNKHTLTETGYILQRSVRRS